jgi:hypothetical protein
MNNKDLINQYVDTGVRLPEHQVNQLPNWAKKTYIRKRMISQQSFLGYEFALLDDDSMWSYFINTINNNGVISDEVLFKTPEHLVHKLVDYTIENVLTINADLFYFSSLDYKQRIMSSTIDKNQRISFDWLRYANDEIFNKFVDNECDVFMRFHTWISINASTYKLLNDELKGKIINAYIQNGASSMSNRFMLLTPEPLQILFVKSIVNSGRSIDAEFYDELSDELKFDYLKDLVNHLWSMRGDEWHLYLSRAHFKDYEVLKKKYEQ